MVRLSSLGENLNATRKRRGPGGAEGRKPDVIHLPDDKRRGCCNETGKKAGGIPKRPTGADCKSAGLRLRWFESTSLHQFQASPDSATPDSASLDKQRNSGFEIQDSKSGHPGLSESRIPAPGGSSSMVEHQFSKLITRVRFPSPAPTRRCVMAALK